MGFPTDVAEKVLVDCGRSCAICHKFCGTKIELHHIVQAADGGEDTYENCIPLCFDCHADVKAYNPRHPKGRKYTEDELKAHRDRWYSSVSNSPAIRSNDEYIEPDRNVFFKLKEYINDDVMNYIRDMDFGGWTYGIDQFNDLHRFIDKCLEPMMQFLDADLEKAKMDFRESLRQMFGASVSYCHCDDGKNCGVPADWTFTNPEMYDKAIDEMNRLSWDVWNSYYNFISLIKRKLII